MPHLITIPEKKPKYNQHPVQQHKHPRKKTGAEAIPSAPAAFMTDHFPPRPSFSSAADREKPDIQKESQRPDR